MQPAFLHKTGSEFAKKLAMNPDPITTLLFTIIHSTYIEF